MLRGSIGTAAEADGMQAAMGSSDTAVVPQEPYIPPDPEHEGCKARPA